MTESTLQRAIRGYRLDEDAAWTCLLTCGHRQHVRHRPPFYQAAWIESDEGRAAHLGTTLRCRLCEQLLLPDDVDYVRTSPVWDEHTLPRALERDHRLATSTWGVLRVLEGQLRFVATTSSHVEVIVTASTAQSIPPEVSHEVHAAGPARFAIEFFRVRELDAGAPGAPGSL